MTKRPFFAGILIMPLIKHWALMHSVKDENFPEHSHQVAVITHLLTTIRNLYFNVDVNPERTATLATYHEVSETTLQDYFEFSKNVKKALIWNYLAHLQNYEEVLCR